MRVRRLRFEALEDRRLLAIIADTFADSFAQVTRITGQEATVLTADAAGNAKIFYHANDELGYIDPATGDLLFADYFAGTYNFSSVVVIDATPNGNLSDLSGVTYSNGQPIIADGGLTVYHRDGSIMRSGDVWTYDAGATFFSAGNWFWSNGNSMLAGANAFHPTGAALRSGSSLFYAGGATFQNGATLNYATGQALRDAGGDYFYEDGEDLRIGDTLYHPAGGVMAAADGMVYNENGDLSFAPYTRTNVFTTSEVRTDVSYVDSHTTIAIANDVGGALGTYITRFDLTYQELPPDPIDLEVTYIDATTLYFSWASGGGSTAGYRVAWADGVSAPGDVSGGVNVLENYYVVTGLTPGQKVSLRVAAKDSEGILSSGVVGTGTVGDAIQRPQTHSLISNALSETFAQVYDTFDKDIILTIDKNNFSYVWYRVNAELGYVNIDNGDRMQSTFYKVPWTNIFATEITDSDSFGNISQIPDGAHYQNGQLVRDGDTYYHENGAVLRAADGTWHYADASMMQSTTTTFWPANITMRSGTTARYPNNAILKSGSTISYQNGNLFSDSVFARYPDASNLKTSTGVLFYETGATLYASNTFRYPAGATMINSAGDPFYSFGSPATLPFENIDGLSNSGVYTGLNVDKIARYAVSVQTNNARHVLGGNVDFSVAPPPNPTNLQVQEQGLDYVIFNFASGGGTTEDYVYAYSLGTTPPWTPDGGTVVAGNSFTITGLAPGEQISVRLFARNSEGEFSPGITAVGTTSELLLGDYNRDNIVDAADYTVWRNTFGTKGLESYAGADGSGNGEIGPEDYNVWKQHYGEVLEPGAGGLGLGSGGLALSATVASIPDPSASSDAGKRTPPSQHEDVATSWNEVPLAAPRFAATSLLGPFVGVERVSRSSALADHALLNWLDSREQRKLSFEMLQAVCKADDASDEVPSREWFDEVLATICSELGG